jgi:hypothetical protein
MKRLLLAAAFACIAGAVNTASHAQTVSFPKVSLDEAGKILNSYPKDLSERDRAKIIYDNIWYLEKIIAV